MVLVRGGPTPYCRGADRRAVLRSSVCEFLAQEFMHALGVPATRVAPSFLRVGQLELFARRARRQALPQALQKLQLIVQHLIARNYRREVAATLPFQEQLITLAGLFRNRLISLVANWLGVGYCQGNVNRDNCAAGGFTSTTDPEASASCSTPVHRRRDATGESCHHLAGLAGGPGLRASGDL